MRKVMIVEDEELIRKGLASILDWEALGMRVKHLAANGREALSLYQEEPVDLIITDISMPVMDGLEFLKKLRETDDRVRVIILSGYEEFEYARKAITLDVEDYILKPIDEEKLEKAVREADEKLLALDQRKTADFSDKAGFLNFLLGNLKKEEAEKYLNILPEIPEGKSIYPAIMKISMNSLKELKITDIVYVLQKEDELRVLFLSADSLLLLYYTEATEEDALRYFVILQNKLESNPLEGGGILTFLTIGENILDYEALPEAYREANKLQKYQIIEGFGSCISKGSIKHRKSSDIVMDPEVLRKWIFKKDKEEAFRYLEDLFINNVKEDMDADNIYRLSLKIAMLLQEIKEEYHLENRETMHNVTELVERIYNALDLSSLKAIFSSEIMEIIACLSEDESHYTPVVKQILSEVKKNYKEDMNLKTLSYKYNMNASYLGQIFQKEVGCSFAQYLSNTKNSIAKDLILNTNMRIHDVAKAVGYPDASYFYRKFKQCYGVSPASLREMRQY